MNIGEAARVSGLSERMIRYYEERGVIPAPERSKGGYRTYSNSDVARMRMIATSQDLGFAVELMTDLVRFIDGQDDADGEAARERVLAEIGRKADMLEDLREALLDEDYGDLRSSALDALLDDDLNAEWGLDPVRDEDISRAVRILRMERPAGPDLPRRQPVRDAELEREFHPTR